LKILGILIENSGYFFENLRMRHTHGPWAPINATFSNPILDMECVMGQYF